jgi:uridine kinase
MGDLSYWIGGGSGAGKSTIAWRIAAQHACTPEHAPYLDSFKTMDPDERVMVGGCWPPRRLIRP